MAEKHILEKGIRKVIGTGEDTKVWEDVWIPTNPARPANPRSAQCYPDLKVHHLIDHDNKTWNDNFVRVVIVEKDANRIFSLRISRTGRNDSYVWIHSKSGSYSVKTGYKVAVEQRQRLQPREVVEPSVNVLKGKVWKLQAPRKIKHFVWQSLSGFVASASKLKERHCGVDSVCQRCGAEQETINHILFECPPSVQCWALSNILSSPGVFPCSSIYVNIETLLNYV